MKQPSFNMTVNQEGFAIVATTKEGYFVLSFSYNELDKIDNVFQMLDAFDMKLDNIRETLK